MELSYAYRVTVGNRNNMFKNSFVSEFELNLNGGIIIKVFW